MAEFHETRMGMRFFEHTMPEVAKQLAVIAKELAEARKARQGGKLELECAGEDCDGCSDPACGVPEV